MPSRGIRVRAPVDESVESFHGHSITENLFNYILKTLPKGSTILELGSGWATGQLAKYYTMYSVEHDKDYLDLYNSTYFHVPLKKHKKLANHKSNVWYNPEILRKELKGVKYDLLLIDGPPHTRSGFFKYMEIFDPAVIMVFDDYAREIEKKLVNSVASRMIKPYVVYCSSDGKPFAVVNDPAFS